jgi:hypothetical protein
MERILLAQLSGADSPSDSEVHLVADTLGDISDSCDIGWPNSA